MGKVAPRVFLAQVVPDDGACLELGIAYCQEQLESKNKLIVGLHTDTRAAFLGAKLNPMLYGALEYIAADTESLLQALENYERKGGTP